MARRIEVEIVGDSRSLERAYKRSEKATQTFSNRIAGAAKVGGVAAGAALGIGIVRGLRASVDAAIEAQNVLGQTKVAVGNAGLSWERYQGRIEDATGALSKLAAVDDEELLGSFSTLVRSTKDVNRALELNALAADIARARHMDVAAAATLLTKVNMGQLGALRRLGIQIDKNATSEEALAALQKRFAGAAAEYGNSAAGAQDRFNVSLQNMEEAIGAGVLPTLTTYLNTASTWLDDTENQRRVTNDLTGAVETLGSVLKVTADTVGVLTAAWDKLPDFGKDKGLLDFLRFGRGGTGFIPGDFTSAGGYGGGGNFPVPPEVNNLLPKNIGAPSPTAGWQGALARFTAQTSGFIDKWLAVGKKAADAQKAAAAAQQAAENYQTRKGTRLGWLDFALERAEATKTHRDDLAVLRQREQVLKAFIRHEGRTLELVSDLWRTRQKIIDLNKKKTAAARDPLAGLQQVSSKRLAAILAAGTGLGAAGRRVLAANIAGAEIRPVHVHVNIDGREVGSVVAREHARTGRRTARQTSGFRD